MPDFLRIMRCADDSYGAGVKEGIEHNVLILVEKKRMVKAGKRISSGCFQEVMWYGLSQTHLEPSIVIANDVREGALLFSIVRLPQPKSKFFARIF